MPGDAAKLEVAFKRPLVPCLFAYLAGCWIAHEALPGWPVVALGIGAAAVCAAFAVAWRRRDSSLLFLLLFAAIGFVRVDGLARERRTAAEIADALDDGAMHHANGRVIAVDSPGDDRHILVLADAEVTSGTGRIAIPGRVRVTLGAAGEQPAMPGDRVACAARIGLITGFRNFFGRDFAAELAKDRIYTAARVPSGAVFRVQAHGEDATSRLGLLLARVRHNWIGSVSAHLPTAEADMVSSMLFNDRALLDEKTQKVFRDAGTMHLFAVSGMHVAMFAFLLGMVLRSLRLTPRASWTAVAVMTLLYVWMIGWVAPAVRAMAMLFAFAAGWWLRREVDSWSALAFAVAAIVAVKPLAAWQAGFLLSVAGVAGILMVMPAVALFVPGPPQETRGTWQGWAWHLCRDCATVTLAATVMVLPLQLHYFGQFNLLSPVVNMVAAPLSGVVLAGALAVVLVAPALPALASVLGGATAAAMKCIHGASAVVAAQDWAIVRSGELPVPAVILYYLVILSGYYVVRRDTPEFAAKSRARLALHVTAAALVLLFATALTHRRQGIRVWFLDVGQGDATFVEFPGGETLLIDAGDIRPDTGRAVVLPHLRGLGLRSPGNVLLTHPDADHIGGIGSVVESAVPERVYGTAGFSSEDGLAEEVLAAVRGAGAQFREIEGGGSITLGRGACLQVLNPVPVADGVSSAPDNDRSVVVRIEYGEFSVLLTGDAGDAVERRLVSEKVAPVDVLKVSHHGSRSASSAGFLAAIHPAAAVISCGRKNRYGHPTQEVLERLESAGAQVYRTDQDGAVMVESDGTGFQVTCVHPRDRQGD